MRRRTKTSGASCCVKAGAQLREALQADPASVEALVNRGGRYGLEGRRAEPVRALGAAPPLQ